MLLCCHATLHGCHVFDCHCSFLFLQKIQGCRNQPCTTCAIKSHIVSESILKQLIISATIWLNGSKKGGVMPASCTQEILCSKCDGTFSKDEGDFVYVYPR